MERTSEWRIPIPRLIGLTLEYRRSARRDRRGGQWFLDPSTAVIHLEFVRAASESTTPLIHLLYSWRDRFPIDRAYVES
jgi:hypothetical protein